MFICLTELLDNIICNWDIGINQFKLHQKGIVTIDSKEISSIEIEQAIVMKNCIAEMPQRIRAIYKHRHCIPKFSKITLKNGQIHLVIETIPEIGQKLFNKMNKKCY